MKAKKTEYKWKQVFVKHPVRSMVSRLMSAIRRRYWKYHTLKWIICSWIWDGRNYQYEEYR